MKNASLICLSYLCIFSFAYDLKNQQIANEAFSVSNSDDTSVKESSTLVGFWFQNTNKYWIYKKIDYLQGVTSTSNWYWNKLKKYSRE